MMIPTLLFMKKERGEKVINFIIKLFVPKKSRQKIEQLTKTFYYDFPKIRWLILPALVSIPIIIVNLIRIYIIRLSVGIEVPFLIFFFIFPIGSLSQAIPFNLGGLSAHGALLVFIFSFYGFQQN